MSMTQRTRRATLRTFQQLVAVLAYLLAATAPAATFTAKSPADVPDSTPGDGICETATGNGVCTLRAAIMEADALAGADTINLQANVTYLLTRVGSGNDNGDLNITDSVTINGAGANSSIIDGNGGVLGSGVFKISACRDAAICDVDHPANIVTISGVGIRHGNSVTGGAIDSAAILTVDHCALTDNHALKYGGALYNNGTALVSNSTVSGNTLDPAPGRGGGLYSYGTMYVRNSTISGNHAVNGGGIGTGSGTLNVINSTVSGNFSDGDGGGIYSAGTTGLFNATVTQNQANADGVGSAVGGGVAQAFGTLSFTNSIIAYNELVVPMDPFPLLDLDDCSGTITSQGNDIVYYAGQFDCTIVGSVAKVDPLLDSLQDNGGPTRTHAILAASPARDAGNTGGCTDDLGAPLATDQRGVTRPNGAYCDIGAFEVTETVFRNGFQP